jgi:hypothetical protein
MQINKSIETKEGTVRFEGEIEGAELDVVLQLGLHALVLRGILTPTYAVKPDNETLQ